MVRLESSANLQNCKMERMSSMLQEQRRINEELMGQMRQMQMSMTDMRSHMAQSDGGTGGVGGHHHQPEIGGFGSGYGGGYGGGKMAMSMYGARSLPYNMRVPKHPGEYGGLTEA